MLDCLRLTPIGLDVVDIGIRRITELGLEVWCLSKAEWFGCWRRRATERGRGTGEGQSDSRFPPGAMTNQSRRGGGRALLQGKGTKLRLWSESTSKDECSRREIEFEGDCACVESGKQRWVC